MIAHSIMLVFFDIFVDAFFQINHQNRVIIHNVDICKSSIVIIMAAIGDSPKKMLWSFVNKNLIGRKIVAA